MNNMPEIPEGYRWYVGRDINNHPTLRLEQRRWWGWKNVGDRHIHGRIYLPELAQAILDGQTSTAISAQYRQREKIKNERLRNQYPEGEVGSVEQTKGLNERFTAWYDRQPSEYIFLLAVSPLILAAVILVVVAIIFG